MTTTHTIRRRVAAGAAALFVAVFSVLWSQAPTTQTQTAQTASAHQQKHSAPLTTKTS